MIKTKRSAELNEVVKLLMKNYKPQITDWDWIDKVILHEVEENFYITLEQNDLEYIKATWKSICYKKLIDR
jgi:hypothetical protein